MEAVILQKLDATFDLVGTLAEGIGELNERVGGLESRMDSLEIKVDSIELRTSSIELTVNDISDRLEGEQVFSSDTRDEHARRLSRIERHLGFLK